MRQGAPQRDADRPRIVTGEAIAATSSGRSVQEDQLRKQARQASGALFAVAVLAILGG